MLHATVYGYYYITSFGKRTRYAKRNTKKTQKYGVYPLGLYHARYTYQG